MQLPVDTCGACVLMSTKKSKFVGPPPSCKKYASQNETSVHCLSRFRNWHEYQHICLDCWTEAGGYAAFRQAGQATHRHFVHGNDSSLPWLHLVLSRPWIYKNIYSMLKVLTDTAKSCVLFSSYAYWPLRLAIAYEAKSFYALRYHSSCVAKQQGSVECYKACRHAFSESSFIFFISLAMSKHTVTPAALFKEIKTKHIKTQPTSDSKQRTAIGQASSREHHLERWYLCWSGTPHTRVPWLPSMTSKVSLAWLEGMWLPPNLLIAIVARKTMRWSLHCSLHFRSWQEFSISQFRELSRAPQITWMYQNPVVRFSSQVTFC